MAVLRVCVDAGNVAYEAARRIGAGKDEEDRECTDGGKIVASIPGKDANENELGLMMAGGGKKE